MIGHIGQTVKLTAETVSDAVGTANGELKMTTRKYEEDYDFSDVQSILEDIESAWWEENETDGLLRTEDTDEAINSELDSEGLRRRTVSGWWFADPKTHADEYSEAVRAGLDHWLADAETEDDEE